MNRSHIGRLVRAAAFAASAAISVTAACNGAGPSSADVEIQFSVEPNPPNTRTPSVVTIEVRDAGRQVSGASVDIEATMTHAGMTPVVAHAAEVNGAYRANLTFAMAGDWVLIVMASLPGGRKAERTLPLHGVLR